MALFAKCITSKEVEKLKIKDMDDYDYSVCKHWLQKHSKLKISRIISLSAIAISLILGAVVSPFIYFVTLLCVGCHSWAELSLYNPILAELKRNGGIKKMKELVKEYEKLPIEEHNTLTYESTTKVNNSVLPEDRYNYLTPKQKKEKFIKEYISNAEKYISLDD